MFSTPWSKLSHPLYLIIDHLGFIFIMLIWAKFNKSEKKEKNHGKRDGYDK